MTTLLTFACLFFSFFIFAQEDTAQPLPLSISEAESSSIVHGCVNAITGTYFDCSEDLKVTGVESLLLQRVYFGSTYVLSSLQRGWQHSHESHVVFWKDANKKMWGRYCEPLASTTFYREPSGAKDKSKLCFHKDVNLRGLTNCGSGTISGKSNLKNNTVTVHGKEDLLTVCHGSHHARVYQKISSKGFCHKIVQDLLPSGNSYNYKYDKEGKLLSVQLCNKDRSIVFGELIFNSKTHKELLKDPTITVQSSDGREVHYGFTLVEPTSHEKKYKAVERFLLTSVQAPGKEERYEYFKTPGGYSDLLVKKILPEGRYLAVDYYLNEKNPALNKRVKSLRAPVGVDGAEATVYRFTYHIDTDKYGRTQGMSRTDVHDALGNRTAYYFGAHDRLLSIEHYEGENKLAKREILYWADDSSEHYGNLVARAIVDPNGNIVSCRSYVYDKFGNVIEESFWGNLSGTKSTRLTISPEGVVTSNGTECFIKTYRFTDDGKNLLVSRTEGNITEDYTYVPGTHLIASKLTKSSDTIVKREFFKYDGNGAEICRMVDNGSSSEEHSFEGVAKRFITRIERTTTLPIGLPKVVEEIAWDAVSGQEKLVKRTENTFTREGWLADQLVIGSEGVHAYNLHWEYDLQGHVTKYVNALGQEENFAYDANGNLIYEQGVDKRLSKEYIYDRANRCTVERERWNDGTLLENRYEYDLLGRKTKAIDVFGNETTFIYNCFGNVIGKTLPVLYDPEGNAISPCYEYAYDVLGNQIECKDPKGFAAQSMYTAYNKPFFVQYPDGTFEQKIYNTEGLLVKAIAQDGSYTLFTYDWQKRCIGQSDCDRNGGIMQTKSWHYDAFHLLAETDPSGITTHYEYDFAGRVVAMRKGEALTEWAYDQFGRKIEEKKWYGRGANDCIRSLYTYDLLDRVIREEIWAGFISCTERRDYNYDEAGNRSSVVRYNDLGAAEERSVFNPAKQPIAITDALGNTTTIHYSYNQKNSWGQGALVKETTNPQGQKTIETCDAHGHIAEIVVKNPDGEVVQQTLWFYDACGNRILRKEIVLGRNQEPYCTFWDFDCCNRLIQFTKAWGTKEAKTSRWSYNLRGDKAVYEKPDGVTLHYTYDALRRLENLVSSDGSVDYTYLYDLMSHPIEVKAHGIKETERTYDVLGRLEKEVLGNGLTLSYEHDHLGRITNVVFPDQTMQKVVYKGNQIERIIRSGSDGKEAYTHFYTRYDLMGKPVAMKCAGNSGQAAVAYDLLGRPVRIETPVRTESVVFDSVGNIVSKEYRDSDGLSLNDYAYDDLYQLSKESGTYAHNYTYDSLHNRTRLDGKECRYNFLNQLIQDENNLYDYDLNGNLIFITDVDGVVAELEYDALDRLIRWNKGSCRCVFTYDADHRRLSKTTIPSPGASARRNYFYIGENEVGSCDEKNTVRELRLLGKGLAAEIGSAVAVEIEGKSLVPIYDVHGNVVSLVDLNGEQTNLYRYSAFGKHQTLRSSAPCPWLFSAKRLDVESGLYFYGRRYYSTSIGRWITPDPLSYEAGPNEYSFLLNAPLTHLDAYGLLSVPSWAIVMHPELLFVDMDKRNAVSLCAQSIIAPKDAAQQKTSQNPVFTNSIMCQGAVTSFQVGSWEYSDRRLGFTNGINTDLATCMGHAGVLSDMVGGYQVDGVHNPTNGVGLDVMRYFTSSRSMYETPVVQALHSNWDRFFDNSSPDSRYMQVAHSEGVNNVRNSLMSYDEERRQRIDVIAVAPSVYIDDNLCRFVSHLVSKNDFVPWIDQKGAMRNADSITLFDPHPDSNFWDHDFRSPTYAQDIGSYVKEYIKTTQEMRSTP